MLLNQPTSELELISSIHGNQRRAERSIEKRDLKAAFKYGTKEEQLRVLPNGTEVNRNKYTFADIVYITDETSRHEITSWVLPLPIKSVQVTDNDEFQYQAAKERIAQDPKIIKSHSVFVIDCSGSMRKSDVEAHRSRSDAVSYAIATEFIAKRLHDPESNVTPYDAVTVIEMRTGAEVVFNKEPMTWVFYNKFIQQSKNSRPSSHGHYIPSLNLAMASLQQGDHEGLALFLFFLSDGRPSDVSQSGMIYIYASAIGRAFKKRLSFGMVGFGNPLDDLTVLQKMTSFMSAQGAVGSFHRSDLKKIGSLGTSLANMSSTLTKTRTLLTLINGEKRIDRSVTISDFKKNITTPPNFWETRTIRQHRLICRQLERSGKDFKWKEVPLLNPMAAGIVYSNDPFGKGTERLVYQLREVDEYRKFVGFPLVGKDSKSVGYNDPREFHHSFCKTQMVAANLANKFNQRLDMSPEVGKNVPRIEFLDCYVYIFYEQNYEFGYLVEKQLDDTQYKKWNDNRGGVHGQRENPVKRTMEFEVDAKKLFNELKPIIQDTIIEEDEEEGNSEDDDSSDEEVEISRKLTSLRVSAPIRRTNKLLPILNEDVPQAFTHFTYSWTKREKMVCDLQGVLDKSRVPPVFEFTDPVIHYQSNSGRTRVFGRTDHGFKGMQEFFKTHKCNNVCTALGIYSTVNQI